MSGEGWAAIPGYEGIYAVSDRGRVMTFHVRRGRVCEDRILRWGKFKEDWYPTVILQKAGKPKTFYVHHLVLLAFVGPCPEGMEVNHKDGVKGNPDLTNLEYVTPSGNTIHAFRTGLRIPTAGMRHPLRKLSDVQVEEMRALRKQGKSVNDISSLFKMSVRHTRAILSGSYWR